MNVLNCNVQYQKYDNATGVPLTADKDMGRSAAVSADV